MMGLSKDNILEELNNCGLTGYEVIYLDTIDSTNTYAMSCAEKGLWAEDKVNVIVANEQTAGKGRLGRSYESKGDSGIYMTLVLRPDKPANQISSITLVAALAVARALDTMGVEAYIKWPNDIILDGRKLCGILTEMRNDMDKVKYVVLGIGVNVNTEAFVEELQGKATSLYLATGTRYSRAKLMAKLVASFEEVYKDYMKYNDLSFMKDEYNKRLINMNNQVIVEYKGEKRDAVQLGIDQSGALKVMVDDSEIAVNSGEILVRGVLGYV